MNVYRHLAGFSSGAIGPDDYDWLVAFCLNNGIEEVWEFGPGDSTYAFLDAECKITSAESDPEWRQRMEERFLGEEGVTVIAYLNEPGCGLAACPELVDLIFVDGPPAWNGGSRCHTLAWAITHGRRVILHDAKRAGEMALLASVPSDWSIRHIPTERGMALLERGNLPPAIID